MAMGPPLIQICVSNVGGGDIPCVAKGTTWGDWRDRQWIGQNNAACLGESTNLEEGLQDLSRKLTRQLVYVPKTNPSTS